MFFNRLGATMIEALSYLPCHQNACTVGVYAVNQGITIAIAMMAIIIATIVFRLTILSLHRWLYNNIALYRTISTIIFGCCGILCCGYLIYQTLVK